MPQKRSALQLEKLCLTRICKSMENYWYRPFEEQFGNTSGLLHIIGPFDHISSELIQLVIDVLVENKLFNPKYLQLLLSNHLNQLDLSKANTSLKQNSIAETIGRRCLNLTRLNLRHCSGLSSKSLVTMVTHLKKLQHLNLASTKCDNQVLAAVAKTCSDLLTLDVSCTKIGTLQPLLSQDSSLPMESLPCPKLRCVDFYLLNVPQEHIVEFLKLRSDILTDFVFDDMIKAIENYTHSEIACSLNNLALENESESDIQEKLQMYDQFHVKSLKIRTLNCDMSHLSPDNPQCLIKTVMTCQCITSVILTNVTTCSHLIPLGNLANLSKLSVNLSQECSDDGLLQFDTGIKPVLEKQGHRIISLDLHGFQFVDIHSVGVLCQKIRRIDLFYTKLAPLSDPVSKDGQYFQKLEEFLYHPLEDEELDLDEVVSPLSFVIENACALRSLTIKYCAELHDTMVSKAVEEHSFRNLEVLDLCKCNTITSESIETLLHADNNLKDLKLDRCWNVNNSNFQDYKRFIKKHKLDVRLVWV
ncbi:uncharacterized protein LOC132552798 [Ylistrum balloti]|uniref:uncharacterized protein LOC132552798 n=1 Tax=Ylistrum balloti TaxID=509963 RepID=UPI002905F489|nr:uncharacterized protein LOC132552798 [Ylistrum balloti]